MVLRLQQQNLDGSWIDEWKEGGKLVSNDGDEQQTEHQSPDAYEDMKRQLAAMQQMIPALTLQLQQREIPGIPTLPSRTSPGVELNPSTSRKSLQTTIISIGGNRVPTSTVPSPATSPSVQLPVQQPSTLQSIEVNPRLSINSIGKLLRTFDGSGHNFESWSQQLELVRTTYNLSDDVTRVTISNKLKGKALNWFHSRPDHVVMPVTMLIGEIKKMFFPYLSKIKLRKQFEDRVWCKAETFSEYVYEKVILANKENIDDSELVEYLIEGIPDESLRDHARMQRFNSKENLLHAFEKITLNKKSIDINKSKDFQKYSSNYKATEADVNNKEINSEIYDTNKSFDKS